jgi:ABC-type polysaccharide/polyol phosphate export permease
MFDKEALPVSTFLGVVISHVITMGFLLIALALFGILPKWSLVGLLAFMLPFGMYVMAWSFLLATLNVYLRDVAQFLPIILQFLFFLTPIVYPLEMAPPWAKQILVLNPHYYIIETYRKTLLIGSFPGLYVILIMTVGAGLFLILSHRIFNKLSPDFADML